MSNETNAVVAASNKTETTKKANAKKTEKKIVRSITKRDQFGNRLATRSHAINCSVIALTRNGKKFSAVECEKHVNSGENKFANDYRKMSGNDVKAVRNHLLFLIVEGHLSFDEASKQYGLKTKKAK